jgi:hypothetical protein
MKTKSSKQYKRIKYIRKALPSDVVGFTPLNDKLVLEFGITCAAVAGKVWRYCRMKDHVCYASQDRMSKELKLKDPQTFGKHMKTLVAAGYFKDLTPDVVGLPHIYKWTFKIPMLDSERAGKNE